MPPLNEVISLGVVPFVLALVVTLVTWRPWRKSSGGGGSGGGEVSASKGWRASWTKDQRRAGALLIGLALVVGQLGIKPDFNWPLDTEDDHRLAIVLGLTAVALFAPTFRSPLWLSFVLRSVVSSGAVWLATFIYRENGTWGEWAAIGYSALMGLGLGVVWSVVQRVSERGPAPVAPFAIGALAGACMPVMIFRAAYITPGQLASVVGLCVGVTFVASLVRARVSLGAGVGVAVVFLGVMLIDIVRVAEATAWNEPNPVPWWWAALLIVSPLFAGAVLLPGIKNWHPFARFVLAAVLSGAAPAALAGIALAEADLAAYGIGGSGSAEPEW